MGRSPLSTQHQRRNLDMTGTINQAQSTLLIIDLQKKLLPVIDVSQEILSNAIKLIQCANLLNINTVSTEQLPDRLGKTVDEVQAHHQGLIFKKSTFSAANNPDLLDSLEPGREVVIFGTETHVCVLQTVLELLDLGYIVWVVSDACGSRHETNKQAGLARMQSAGATLVTTEMVIFEWLADAEHPRFREMLALIK